MKKLIKWFENYWYHYKTATIITAFFVLFIIIGTAQLFNKEKYDVNIIYTGPIVLTPSEIHSVEEAFEQAMSRDYNDDGKKSAGLLDISLMTEKQILNARDKANKEGEKIVISVEAMRNAERNFTNQMLAGEAVICLLDPHWYQQVKDSSGFMTLQSAIGYTPEYAFDEYAVRLFDTEFGRYFTIFSIFPEDTLLSIRFKSTVKILSNKKKEEKRHQIHVEMFKDLIAFSFPEGYVPPSETEAATTLNN